MRYAAPLADMRFVLQTVIGFDRIRALPGCGDFDEDAAMAVLAGAGDLCSGVLAPLNPTGDAEGCTFEQGRVRTPAGFPDAYRLFRDGGWTGLAADAADGGHALPRCLDAPITEMICGANLSFGIIPGLSAGAYRTIKAHAEPRLAAATLPHLASGAWSGTMCLSEPHCGSDLGLVRTRAAPAADGGWRVSGSKIFVSGGQHDLTDNILHLVLARAPGGPAGSGGLSLLLVPRICFDGTANSVACTGIEDKMGLHASPTCTLAFEAAQGWLVGELHHGMRAMFSMMNDERLSVGLQGLGLAEAATQSAYAWAGSRLQGRAAKGARRPDLPADPIIVHADIRRMLLTMRAYTEGMRAMAAWIAWHADLRDRTADAAARDLVDLMTPVVKALFTDLGFEVVNFGLQVMGGHGYIRGNGMEQMVRDARIGQIYEGTNGIQALDLVGRKIPAHCGRLARRFFHPLQQAIDAMAAEPAMAAFAPPLAQALARLQRATAFIARAGEADADAAAAAACDYLHLMGLVAMGWLWARMVAGAMADGVDIDFRAAKIAAARVFFTRILPRTSGLTETILGGAIAESAI